MAGEPQVFPLGMTWLQSGIVFMFFSSGVRKKGKGKRAEGKTESRSSSVLPFAL